MEKNGEKVCDFLICNDCAPARFDKENKVKAMANGGSNNRRSARKKRKWNWILNKLVISFCDCYMMIFLYCGSGYIWLENGESRNDG